MNWVVGDVHGMLSEFESVIAQIEAKDFEASIYCVGDFCDRGYNSKGVVDVILSKSNIKCVRGNHDDIFDCILSGKPTQCSDDQTYEAPLSSLSWFLQFGMWETLGSYGMERDVIRDSMRSLSSLASLMQKIPAEHHEFYKNLPLMIHGDGFFVAHASVVPECNLDDILEYDTHRKAMIWGRYTQSQIDQPKAWGKTGYFGHTPTKHYGKQDVIFGDQCVLCDTGSFFSKKISAVCHETKEVVTS